MQSQFRHLPPKQLENADFEYTKLFCQLKPAHAQTLQWLHAKRVSTDNGWAAVQKTTKCMDAEYAGTYRHISIGTITDLPLKFVRSIGAQDFGAGKAHGMDVLSSAAASLSEEATAAKTSSTPRPEHPSRKRTADVADQTPDDPTAKKRYAEYSNQSCCHSCIFSCIQICPTMRAVLIFVLFVQEGSQVHHHAAGQS